VVATRGATGWNTAIVNTGKIWTGPHDTIGPTLIGLTYLGRDLKITVTVEG